MVIVQDKQINLQTKNNDFESASDAQRRFDSHFRFVAGKKVVDFQKSNWLRDDQKFVKGDLLDLKALKTALFGMDIVYHFAALADLNEAINKPLETININILGNANILEACKEFL